MNTNDEDLSAKRSSLSERESVMRLRRGWKKGSKSNLARGVTMSGSYNSVNPL
jgi:hypothetical protein